MMKVFISQQRTLAQNIAVALGLAVVISGCGKKEEPPVKTPATAPVAAQGQTPAIPPAAAIPTSWSAEALEELLSPVALYPDPILTQVLVASGNPQEVLDAGNWLLQNEGLKGAALEQAASKVGFTPPAVALLQFPATLDMMCQEMAWTTELGQAFAKDQEGVLAAVQRLRAQAVDVGNLKTTPQMTVSMEDVEGSEEQAIYLKPTDPEVIYVPQYDPVAAYAPAPVETTTVVQEGHSTAALVTTGLLAFGAGMLVNEIFDDDYDDYYPHYGYHGGYYPYRPYPYRPVYGGGYYPSNGYYRPPGYNSGWNNNGWQNNNNGWQNNGNINTGDININTGGNRFGGSPISKNNPKRDLSKINQRPNGANGNRPSATTGKADWKGQSGYAGAKGSSKGRPSTDMANKGLNQAKSAGGKTPKLQGSYAGGNAARDMQATNSGNRQGSNAGKSDWKGQSGYTGAKDSSKGRPSADMANKSLNQARDGGGKSSKYDGGYAGGNATRDMQTSKSGSRDAQQRPQQQKQSQQKSSQYKQSDRGRNQSGAGQSSSRQSQQNNRQSSSNKSGGGNRNSAMSGSRSSGSSARASSQRGQQSRSKSGGGNRSKRN